VWMCTCTHILNTHT